MRIAFLAPFARYPKGTVDARLLPLARALVGMGHQVRVVIPPWDNPPEVRQGGLDAGVDVRYVPVRPGRLWTQALPTARAMGQTVREFEPQWVHCFKPRGFSSLAAMALYYRAAKTSDMPKLAVDCDDWEGPDGWDSRLQQPWPLRRFFAYQSRWLLHRADVVTIASRALSRLLAAQGVPTAKLRYLPNGAEQVTRPSERQAAAPRGDASHRAPNVLWYTRFNECALDRLLDIWKAILAARPDARLTVVGGGLAGEERTFQALVQEQGLAARISMLGWLPPERLEAAFAATRVALYPLDDTTINNARCPAKLVQLMARGTAIITEHLGQMPEYIIHQRSGLLVPPGDLQGMAEWAVRVLENGPMRHRLEEGARQAITNRYLWQMLARTLEEAYQPARPRFGPE